MPKTNRMLIIVATGLVAGLTTQASAQDVSAPKEVDALFACQSKTDNAARLECFDETVSALRIANESGNLATLSRDEVKDFERDGFGFNLPSLPQLRGLFGSKNPNEESEGVASSTAGDIGESSIDAEPLDRVTLSVDRWETFNRGRYRFYLTNGQVWSQTESDQLRRPRAGDSGVVEVEIRKASFGSFLLQLNGKGRSVRVRRTE